ncbi:MAG: hypothetical protein U5K75_08055 [Ahrensia sp.]|nr:hypothetical protein [Ahrensia sp.]
MSGGSKIDLEMLRADMVLDDGERASLTSAKGTFDSDTSILILPVKATVQRSDGLEVIMGAADVDIGTGAVSARENVHVLNEKIDIKANQMEIVSGGKQFIFKHNVRVLLIQKAKESANARSTAN